MLEAAPDLTLVIAAWNEARRLPATLAALRGWAATRPESLEVLVVDDGSTDQTAQAALNTAAEWPVVRLLGLECNRGKGAAVRRGMLAARGRAAGFLDADLPYDLAAIGEALAGLAAGADVVIGGRDLPASRARSAPQLSRRISGRAYAWLVNRLAVRGIPDTQCGFKLFTAQAARALFARTTLPGFAFDVELLTAAQRMGLRIERIPVTYLHSDDSRVRLVRDSLRMFRDLLRVNRRRARGVYDPGAASGVPHACPGCGADEPAFERGCGGWIVARCGACGLLHLWNRPPEKQLAGFYNREYYQAGGTGGGYSDYEAQRPDLLATARERVARLAQHQPSGRLLEIGCGYGFFLEAANSAYPHPVGIDLSEVAVARAREAGHAAHAGTLEQLPESAGQFDIIYAADLFEHLYHPREFLAAAAKRLNPGGLLALVTPNEAGWLRKLSGSRWVSFKFPEHVAFYTPGKLDEWMREAGFSRVYCAGVGQKASVEFLLPRLRTLSPAAGLLGRIALLPWKLTGRSLVAPTGNMFYIARKGG